MNQNGPALQGSMVALVTPMNVDGSIDWSSLDKLVEFHIAEGTNTIVAVGTTGESATLSVSEHLQVIERVVERVNGRISVVAGTGANSTAEAVELTKSASSVGVDACLLVVPYYNKPTQEGLFRHFSFIADAVDIPQILYNVPGRTITDMQNDIVLRLSTHQNIMGIKDATGDVARGKALIESVAEDFYVYSGDDITAPELMLVGAKGNISVTANVAPRKMAELCRRALAKEVEATRSLQTELMPLHDALFIEANPIPVKWAVSALGLMSTGIRLPLTPPTDLSKEALRTAMTSLSLI
jgi:4-hydroxy-tetrahydrodipicolinate synthase